MPDLVVLRRRLNFGAHRAPGGKLPTPREIQNYLNRVSGPLLDRIAIHVKVPAVKFREIIAERTGETSAQIRERVVAARRRRQERLAGKRNVTCNARMGARDLKAFYALDEATLELLKMAMNELKLSARAYDWILKVARTIADLVGSEIINSDHVSEAIQYRSLDRQMWARGFRIGLAAGFDFASLSGWIGGLRGALSYRLNLRRRPSPDVGCRLEQTQRYGWRRRKNLFPEDSGNVTETSVALV